VARDYALRLAVGIERAAARTSSRTFFFTGVRQRAGRHTWWSPLPANWRDWEGVW
jgi:hypothetical protein